MHAPQVQRSWPHVGPTLSGCPCAAYGFADSYTSVSVVKLNTMGVCNTGCLCSTVGELLGTATSIGLAQ